MSTFQTAKRPSRLDVIASMILGPIPMLSMLYLLAVVGSLSGHTWAISLFWSLMILVAATTVAALAGARPLPRLADRSHLVSRLSWLGRYGTGAFLLCISTFLGGLTGAATAVGSAQDAVDALFQLVGSVGLYAIEIAIVIFLMWLAIDVGRLGIERRRTGMRRSITYIAGRRTANVLDHPAVMRWLDALTSPFLVTFAAVAAVGAILLQMNGYPLT